MFGDLFTMPGGHALQHNADVILRVNRTKPDVNGQIIKVSTPSKNRLFRPFQSIEMRLEYENGFTKENKINNFLQFLKKIEVICSAGAYNYFRADVDEIMEKEGLSEKEATKKAKKFHLKAVVEQMVNDEDYYKKMIDKAEQLVNTSLLKVLKVMQDPEFKEEIDKEEALEVAIENEFNTSKSIEE
jgi:RecA/RadA recombinase